MSRNVFQKLGGRQSVHGALAEIVEEFLRWARQNADEWNSVVCGSGGECRCSTMEDHIVSQLHNYLIEIREPGWLARIDRLASELRSRIV